MVEKTQVARSKRIQRRTGKTFHVATRVLPERIRRPTYVLYGFFRIADEIVDAPDTGPPDEQRAELERLRRAALGEERTDDPVLDAFATVCAERGIDEADVHAFVDAMASDIDTDRYETAREAVLDADSWVGRAITEWNRRADTDDPDPALGQDVEERLDAPETPGWD
jgi:phytoene synthase